MSKETEKADEIDRGIHKEIREKRTGVRKFMADLLNMHDGMMSYEEIDEMMDEAAEAAKADDSLDVDAD